MCSRNQKIKTWLAARAKSFKYAFHGVLLLFKEGKNARIQLVAATIVVFLGILLEIKLNEWMIILILIGAVLSLEAVNTSIEELADAVTREKHPAIKKTKDLAAGAVLIASFISLVIGMIIFIPKFIYLFYGT